MTTIVTKNGSGAPLASDLVQGELAVDLTNKRLYTEDSGGTVIEVGTSPSTIDINAGTIDGTVIGGASAAAGTFTTFTSTGIDDNATSTAITIDSSENVGIGTASPSTALHIDTGATNDAMRLVSTDADVNILMGDNTGSVRLQNSGGDFVAYTGTSAFGGFAETMRIDSIGRVGIGTESPTVKLQVTGSGSILRVSDDTSTSGTIELSASSSVAKIHANTYSAAVPLAFEIASSEKMRIDSSGNVGIGTTSPSGGLHVKSSTNTVTFESTTNGLYNTFISTAGTFGYLGSGSQTVSGAATTDFGIQATTGNFVVATGGNTERMRIDSSGDLLLGGTTSYTSFLSASTGNLQVNGGIIGEPGSGNAFEISNYRSAPITFLTSGNIERMRIDSSGRVFIGKTSDNDNTAGHTLHSSGLVVHTRDSAFAAIFNRTTDDGDIVQFKQDGTTVGSIGNFSSGLEIQNGANYGLLIISADTGVPRVLPRLNYGVADNVMDLGDSGSRYDDIYATNGTIQTSDANEKQDIEALSEAETRVAVAAKALLRKFRWKSAVRTKSHDARIHFGIIAQDLQAAFEAEGLDAGEYGMFTHSTWTDEETGEERSRMGVRYSELLAFIIAAI